MAEPKFRKGIDKVQKSAQKGGGGGGARTRFINWESGETKTIRFLTEGDEIVLTNLHEWVTTHDGGHQTFVCRQEVGENCELCDKGIKRREMAYAVALERVPGKNAEGESIFKTKTEEIEVEDDNGKTQTKRVPVVGIIRQAPRNFWGWFYEAFDKSGTLLDRDFSITRRGKQKETTYQPYPEDKQVIDLSKFEEFKPDLEGFLTRLASKEFYDKFLHGVTASKDEEDSQQQGSSELTPEDLEKLRKANEEVAVGAESGEWDD